MKYELGKCRLKEILTMIPMSQSELSRKVGIDRREASRFATNKNRMTLENALSIAATLECDVKDLYELVEIKLTQNRAIWRPQLLKGENTVNFRRVPSGFRAKYYMEKFNPVSK